MRTHSLTMIGDEGRGVQLTSTSVEAPEGYDEIDPVDIQAARSQPMDLLQMGPVRLTRGETVDLWLTDSCRSIPLDWLLVRDLIKSGAHLFRKREPRVVEFEAEVKYEPMGGSKIRIPDPYQEELRYKRVTVRVEEVLE